VKSQQLIGQEGIGGSDLRAPAGMFGQSAGDFGAALFKRFPQQGRRGGAQRRRAVAFQRRKRIRQTAPIDDRAPLRQGFEPGGHQIQIGAVR
jgi:hypothetical protein